MERAGGIVSIGVLMDLDEYLLKEIVPVFLVDARAYEIAVHRPAVPLDEHGERPLVALTMSDEKRF